MKTFIQQKSGLLILTILALSIILGGCALFNNSPVISSVHYQKNWIDTSTSCQIECVASDIDDDTLAYTWSAVAGVFSGNGPLVTWTAPEQAGIYVITVGVVDEHGANVTSQIPIDVRFNHQPVIKNLTAELLEMRAKDTTTILCVASDLDGDVLSYSWSTNGGKILGQGSSVTWTAPEEAGTYSVRVEVADDRGGKSTAEQEVIIKKNQPPVIRKLNARTLEVNPGVPVKIECAATDPEGDGLSYAWTASGGSIIGEGPTINWRAPEEYGNYIVGVIVSDDREGQTNKEVSIEVKNCG